MAVSADLCRLAANTPSKRFGSSALSGAFIWQQSAFCDAILSAREDTTGRAAKFKKILTMKTKEKLMSIGKAAGQAGVSVQSLQYYIMVGLVKPKSISDTNRRLFDDKTVERIKLIKKLNKSGYPLRAIRELFLEGRLEI